MKPPASELSLSVWFADATASHDAREETVQSGPTTVEGSLAASMAAGSIPFYPLAFPSNDSTGPSEAGLLLQAGGDPFGTGFMSSDPSARGPEVAAIPVLAVVPDPFPQSIEEINIGIKHQLMKEVRQFGRSKWREDGSNENKEGSLSLWLRRAWNSLSGLSLCQS